MSEFKDRIDELAELMREFHLAEAELKGDDWKIAFRRGRRQDPGSGEEFQPALMLLDSPAATVHAPPSPSLGTPVNSPMNGIYFATPSPNSPPFVREGDTISAGQVVGLIEAMKVFNDITSPMSGIVRKIVVESGQLVQPGDPLLYIE